MLNDRPLTHQTSDLTDPELLKHHHTCCMVEGLDQFLTHLTALLIWMTRTFELTNLQLDRQSTVKQIDSTILDKMEI